MRKMKYVCLGCGWVSYSDGFKDGVTCTCGGKLDPLGWEDLRKGPIDMYKKAVHSREELNRVIEALDQLGKYYMIHKRIHSTDVTVMDERGIPRGITAGSDVWYVTEVEPQSGAPSAAEDDFEQEFKDTAERMHESREQMHNRKWQLIRQGRC